MEDPEIIETYVVGNVRLDLIYIERHHGLEAYVDGEFFDVQSYEYDRDALRDFEAFKAGHKTLDEIFG